MKTAIPVPSTPPTALVTGLRRTSRSKPTSTEIPTAAAAAVSSPAMALTVTNATGPMPVSNIARLSVKRSNGLGGSLPRPGSGSGLGLGGRKHQVVEEPRGEAPLEQPPVHVLQQQVAVVRVADPRHRDRGRIGAGLERAVEPPEPVGQQLLAAHADVAQPGR